MVVAVAVAVARGIGVGKHVKSSRDAAASAKVSRPDLRNASRKFNVDALDNRAALHRPPSSRLSPFAPPKHCIGIHRPRPNFQYASQPGSASSCLRSMRLQSFKFVQKSASAAAAADIYQLSCPPKNRYLHSTFQLAATFICCIVLTDHKLLCRTSSPPRPPNWTLSSRNSEPKSSCPRC